LMVKVRAAMYGDKALVHRNKQPTAGMNPLVTDRP
jgi:hypothetical protein